MKFFELEEIIRKNNIPKDVALTSDSGWECGATDMDAIFYSKEKNEIVFTQEKEFRRTQEETFYTKKNGWERLDKPFTKFFSLKNLEDLKKLVSKKNKDSWKEINFKFIVGDSSVYFDDIFVEIKTESDTISVSIGKFEVSVPCSENFLKYHSEEIAMGLLKELVFAKEEIQRKFIHLIFADEVLEYFRTNLKCSYEFVLKEDSFKSNLFGKEA